MPFLMASFTSQKVSISSYQLLGSREQGYGLHELLLITPHDQSRLHAKAEVGSGNTLS